MPPFKEPMESTLRINSINVTGIHLCPEVWHEARPQEAGDPYGNSVHSDILEITMEATPKSDFERSTCSLEELSFLFNEP